MAREFIVAAWRADEPSLRRHRSNAALCSATFAFRHDTPPVFLEVARSLEFSNREPVFAIAILCQLRNHINADVQARPQCAL